MAGDDLATLLRHNESGAFQANRDWLHQSVAGLPLEGDSGDDEAYKTLKDKLLEETNEEFINHIIKDGKSAFPPNSELWGSDTGSPEERLYFISEKYYETD